MPRITTQPADDSNAREDVQIVIKEFPDKRSGLLVEVYPEDNHEAYANGPLRSASCVYMEDIGAKKTESTDFIDEVNEWVGAQHPDDLYAFVVRTDDDDGYRIEVGEDWGGGVNHVRLIAEFTDEELGLEPIPELQDL